VRPRGVGVAASVLVAATLLAPAARGAETAGAAPTGPSAPTPAAALPAPAVLEPADAAAAPTRAGLQAVLDALLAAPALADPGAVVVSAGTRRALFARDGRGPRTPASVAKLLTAAMVLTRREPAERLVTTVVRGSRPGTVVLVGAGDPLLTVGPDEPGAYPQRASLAALADQLAPALAATAGPVRVAVDDSAFAGPSVSPDWEDGYVPGGVVAPVSALVVDGARVRPDSTERHGDPALAAGRAFAALLRERGLEVADGVRREQPASPDASPAPAPQATPPPTPSGPAPTAPAPAPQPAWEPGTELARAQSPPLAVLVEQMLMTSDNDAAEALARLAAEGAGQPASFDGVGAAALSTLGELGIAPVGVRLLDGSGLARGSTLPPRTVGELLAAASSADRPELRPLITGLPVAGLTGTLADRFGPDAGAQGVGEVRAKTGTLTGVSALAGTAVDEQGRLLLFAVMSDAVAADATLEARAGLDRIAAALAACGCP
jgi:D-alanyl-D-alanine carboxypeptidase/D-alanyl-D-alanine-endopeptidase (penicillin-binding protein 4)